MNLSIKSNNFIYKICSIKEWEKALSSGIFIGTDKDLRDNYIHFSTKNQLLKTLTAHFKEKKNLCLLKLSSNKLNIKWELSRENELYPHLYDKFNVNQVLAVYILKHNANGNFVLPSLK